MGEFEWSTLEETLNIEISVKGYIILELKFSDLGGCKMVKIAFFDTKKFIYITFYAKCIYYFSSSILY